MTARVPEADQREVEPVTEGPSPNAPPPEPAERPPQQEDLRCTICGLPSCWR
jgi:hypothetical protein